MSIRDGLSDIERPVSLPVHPRISLHQVAFVRDGTPAFVEFCRKNSVPNMTLASSLIMGPNDVEIIKTSAAEGGPKASVVNHPFAVFPNLEEDTGQAGQKLLQAIDVAASIGAARSTCKRAAAENSTGNKPPAGSESCSIPAEGGA